MTQRLWHIEYVVTFALLMVASGAAAQEVPAVDVTGGYQVHAVGGFPETGSFDTTRWFSGWFASGAWNATSNWGVVFETAKVQRGAEFIRRDVTRDLVDGRLVTVRREDTRVRRDYTIRLHGVGIRYRRATGRMRPFAQLLIGRMSHESADTPPPPPLRFQCSSSGCVPVSVPRIPTGRDGPYRYTMMWPGGGVDIHLLDRAAVRFQVDSVGHISGGFSFPRFLVSAVYQIGHE